MGAGAPGRRTWFVSFVAAALVALTIAWIATSPGRDERPPAPLPAMPEVEVPPSYLAWMPGGFPAGFRSWVDEAPGIRRAVVVAGDTRWLTASRDATGAVRDDPPDPFAIPIDAFAVDPDEYRRFVPREVRTRVTEALGAGEAVLSATGARLRRLGSGGVLTFGALEIPVGAIVPDRAIGWSEVLVSRVVGRRLGIEHERYLLAVPRGRPSESVFEARLRPGLPDDALLRVALPGSETFHRVASGVNPPVVMKSLFGEFSAHPEPGDEAFLVIDPTWEREHLATREVPILGTVTCNVALFDPLVGALEELDRRGLDRLVHSYAGCYAARTIARTPTAPPSQHAYGAAIDINAEENPFGAEPTLDRRVVAVFERWGFVWGGEFLIPDGQHFEFLGPAPEG